MSIRSQKMFRSALKKAPKKIDIAKIKGALQEVGLVDAMQRAQSLLGDVKLEERRPAFFEGFCYLPLKSKAGVGADGKLYGNRFSSVAFFYGAKKIYVYSRTVCYDTDIQQESFADFNYQDFVGVELVKMQTPYRDYTKRSIRQHGKDLTLPLRERIVGVALPVLKIVFRTLAGVTEYYLNGDADCEGGVESFVKELRAVIDSKQQ